MRKAVGNPGSTLVEKSTPEPSTTPEACSTSHPNIETLKRKLKAPWEEIDPEVVRATCAQVLPRLRLDHSRNFRD